MTPEDFRRDIENFDTFGAATQCYSEAGIPYYENEFWTAAQRQSHTIHEISYRACFKAELPRFFISRLSDPGHVVFDPFMGRGTTLVEAAILGRVPAGNDISPLSSMLVRPRLNVPDREVIDDAIDRLPFDGGIVSSDDGALTAFYEENNLRELCALRSYFSDRLADSEYPDPALDWIRMVCLNRLSGHSTGYFSRKSMPPNQAVSIAAQERLNERNAQTPIRKDLRAIMKKKTRSLLRSGDLPSAPDHHVFTGPADTVGLADASVDLVVTSPPFLDVVQYAKDNWLRCWFAGIDADSIPISVLRAIPDWEDMVFDVLTELHRVLRPGGHIAFEVGEVRGGSVKLEQNVWKVAGQTPLERHFVIVNDQDFTKTSACWGVANGARGTNSNRIVILRKPESQA